jgi:hypothetical protein
MKDYNIESKILAEISFLFGKYKVTEKKSLLLALTCSLQKCS